MSARLQNIFVVVLLSFALVVPKMTAALTTVLPGFSVVVLCTGHAMQRITIGPDGQPVEVEQDDHAPCVIANPEQVDQPTTTDWVALTRSYASSFIAISHPAPKQVLAFRRPPPQAPPTLLI